jgi:pimeloyl-ACP methyl ester carboxylesterase
MLCVCTAAPAIAQDTPAVFLHGFKGSADQWIPTATRLSQSIALEPHTPSLPWTEPFAAQAADLQSRSDPGALPSSMVVVGHSNGGLVARAWAQLRPMGGIATIGTPHQGAPIIPHFSAWAAYMSAGAGFVNETLAAFGVYTDWSWVLGMLPNALHFTSDYSLWSVVYLAATLGVDVGLPVAVDMGPGSSFLQQLNSAANLAHEAGAAPRRVGIVSVAHNFFYAGPARAILPDSADAIATGVYAVANGLVYWSSYIQSHADPTDIAAIDQSLALINTAGYLFSIDPIYCGMVSRSDLSQCIPNDGVVPETSQQFPNAPNIFIGANNDGPAHTQERDQADDALYQALVWYLGVRSRSDPAPAPLPPPPPPPLTPGSMLPPAEPAPAGVVPVPATRTDDGESGGGGTGTATGTGTDGATLTTTTVASSADIDPDVLHSGDALTAGQTRVSADHRFYLIYQSDGNLVLYTGADRPLWASGTVGTAPGVVAMQSDGNLVIYDEASTPIWASNTFHEGAAIIVQTDGNLVMYAPDGTPVWATGTVQ